MSPRNQLLYPFTELFTEGLFVDSANGILSISNLNGWEAELVQIGINTFSQAGTKYEYQYVFDSISSRNTLYTALGTTYKKTPIGSMLVLTTSLLISTLVLGVSQIIFLIRVINFIKRRSLVLKPQLILEIGSLILFIGCVIFLFAGLLENIHEPNLLTAVLFLCTVLFPLLTAIGVIGILRFKFHTFINRIWTITLATSMIILSLYLTYWGLLGFAIWSY